MSICKSHKISAFYRCIYTYKYNYYLYLIGRVCVFYVGHVDKSSLYETLFHCNILSRHQHHHHVWVMSTCCEADNLLEISAPPPLLLLNLELGFCRFIPIAKLAGSTLTTGGTGLRALLGDKD
jgi:hypothetical protein